MHWVIQNNMFAEKGYHALVNALKRLDLPYTPVKVIPFTYRLDPDVNPSSPVIVMGSYTMSAIALARCWSPGCWIDNLDFERQLPHWGEHMLNHDAEIVRLADAEPWIDPKFIRPAEDSKAFVGRVMDWPSFEEWKAQALALSPDYNSTITADLRIMVSSTKTIYNETRVWIVKGKPVTASGYKVGRRVRYTAQVDDRIITYAHDRAQQWSPNDAYCLDIADTPDGLRIVEAGNITACGFYAGDMMKLVMALEEAFDA